MPILASPGQEGEHPPRFLKLAALYAGECLDQPEFSEFTNHLHTCDVCRAWVEYWRQGSAVLDGVRSLISGRLRRRHRRQLTWAFIAGIALTTAIIPGYLVLRGYNLNQFF